MPRRPWLALLSLWPGLAQVWTGQEVLGLILAALFAASANAAILSLFVWTDALPAAWPPFFALVAALTWAGALAYTLWWSLACHPEGHRDEIDLLYRSALEAYLQARFDDARRLLESILARDEDDADALLQLATLYARTGRPDLARRTYRQCLDLPGGSKWRWEVHQALARLDRT
jgi:tetratricopeptide (TPR) repeat protein